MHPNSRPILDRAADKFEIGAGDCWEWTGALTHDGYGRLQVAGRARMAHRVIYEEVVEVIPEGLDLDHLCGVRRCVNPDHLEPVTQIENTRRARAKDFCVNGHPFVPENRYYSGGRSTCRPCSLAWHRARGVA